MSPEARWDGDAPARVLMTVDTVGGVWTCAVELAAALEQAGVTVALATMGRKLSRAQRADLEGLEHTHVHESEYRLEWMGGADGDVREAGQWLLDIERSFRPDVVHLNGYAHGVLPWAAPTIVVGHSCVMSWWEAVRPADALPEASWYRQTVRAGLQAADLVVTPTYAMLDALQRHYGTLRRARVVANGRDRRRFPVGVKAPFVFTAGRLWDPATNVAALERVAPQLSWPVCAAGEVTDSHGQALSLSSVTCLGPLAAPQMASWFGQASIYALPARYEPFGLSVLEAALAGCAMVLGDIGSLRELWEGVALFAGDDDGELAQALTWLIDHPDARQVLGIRARNRALKLSPRAMASGYLDAYREVRERLPVLVH